MRIEQCVDARSAEKSSPSSTENHETALDLCSVVTALLQEIRATNHLMQEIIVQQADLIARLVDDDEPVEPMVGTYLDGTPQ